MKVAVASGKGGTGKTTIATNLVRYMAEMTDKALYVDCDVEEPNGHLFLKPEIRRERDVSVLVPEIDGNLCTGCGECKKICAYNAITIILDKALVFPELCHSCGGCQLVCPEEAIEEKPRRIGVIMEGDSGNIKFISGKLDVGEASATPLVREVKKAIPDFLDAVIDAPPGTSCPVIETVRDTDYVLLVTEPTPFGLNDLRIAVETVRQLYLPFGVIINRADSGNSGVNDYCLDEEIPVLAEIPDDRKAAELYSQGKLLYRELPYFREQLEVIYSGIIKQIEEYDRESFKEVK